MPDGTIIIPPRIGAMAERSDSGLVPWYVNYEAILRLAKRLRKSLAQYRVAEATNGPAPKAIFFTLESTFCINFEKFLENIVTFWPVSRLYK